MTPEESKQHDNGREDGYSYLLGWSLYLFRAIHERPMWAKWLLKIALGRYAYRELIGLRKELDEHGFDTQSEYGLKDMSYLDDFEGKML